MILPASVVMAQPSVYTRTYVDRIRDQLLHSQQEITKRTVEQLMRSLDVPSNMADDILCELLSER